MRFMFIVSFVALAASGCRSLSPEEVILYERRCVAHDRPGYDQCRRSRDAYLDACWGTCTTVYPYLCTCDTVDRCVGIPTVCVEEAHVFTPARVADAPLGDACIASMLHDIECGGAWQNGVCERAERIERSEMRERYACLAALPCGADRSVCAPGADQYLVPEVCNRTRCTVETLEALDARDGWLRDEVVDALFLCDGDVGARAACVEGWLDMVGIPH